MKNYVMLDVGGTNIKSAFLTVSDRVEITGKGVYDAKAHSDRETILSNMCSIIENADEIDCIDCIDGIGIAFPGPFDYENGICLMKGLNKYESIYSVSLKEEIYTRIFKGKTDIPIVFMHDIEAFARGICAYEPYGKKRILHLCIGTGAGSAFSDNGNIITDSENVPENGWIYNCAFKDSVIDDYISARGLENLALKYTGHPHSGFELYNLAKSGDSGAKEVFKEFSENTAAAIEPFLESFKPEILVLAGQISKSYEFFSYNIEDICRKNKCDIIVVENTSDKMYLGLLSKFGNIKN